MIIGLTVVAVGTSLPKLASSVIAAHKAKHNLARGNMIGFNLFNTLAIVVIGKIIHPMSVDSEALYRDVLVMALLTGMLFAPSYGFRRLGPINRYEGGLTAVS